MDPQRWARVKDLFHAALACKPDRRDAFLLEAASDDASLREEVASMLARQPDAAAFLETPALQAEAAAMARDLEAGPSLAAFRAEGGPVAAASAVRAAGASAGGSSPGAPEAVNRRRPSSRPPWWMFILAAIFVTDALLRAWGWIAGPAGFGFTTELAGGQVVVRKVAGGGLADRAGIKPGDIITACDGQPCGWILDRRRLQANLEVNRGYRFDLSRDGHDQAVAIQIRRKLVPLVPGAHALWHLATLAMLGTALLIAFTRPRDSLARLGALTLAALGLSFYVFNLAPGYAVAVRRLPWGTGTLLLVSNLAVALVGPIGLSFFLRFPRPLFRRRWPWAIVWLPGMAALPAYVYAMTVVYRPELAPVQGAPERAHMAAVGTFAAYALAMLIAISANYFRLADANEKRRLRVLVAGGAIGTLPGLTRLGLTVLAPQSSLTQFLRYGWPDVPVAVGFLLFPASFAYAVLRHRVLGVRVIVRLGVQYALARGLVISLVPVLGLILAADALVHGDEPLIEIVRARGWIYALVGGLAAAVHTQRHRMAKAIDRRFFRDHYDASRLLRQVADEARRAGSIETAAPAVVARIEAALHPAFVALLTRLPGDVLFRSLAAAPAGAGPLAIEEGNPLVMAVRATNAPVQTTGYGSARGDARPPDSESDRPSDVALVVPVAMTADRPEALLAFGARRSEEPYTREDLDSLEAIGASLALLLDHPVSGPDRLSSTFGECPVCGSCYEPGTSQCAREDRPLVVVSMPRTLAGRYRLERRLGRGGMGKVYEAVDTALERRVAVKVIRDEWVHSSAAIARFRREARAVAGLVHPNVVTVYDYGIETGRRAFLVMELLAGTTLGDEIRRSGRLPAARTVEVFRGVCSAVDAAHRHRIVHRDLKPENVFLVAAGDGHEASVKVLDFGVAKPLPGAVEEPDPGVVVTETDIGVLVGTIGYMSPGQLLGERPDVSWDLWALGVVAYEALTGALPFPVTSREAWRKAVLAGRYTPLGEHLANSPAAWEDFVARCLSPDRAQRPGSAAEFFQQLEQALG